jgi:hypothetical protein
VSLRDLKARYGGPNTKSANAYNRAIRSELVGGDDLLDAMERVERLVSRLSDRDLAAVAAADRALEALREVKAVMIGIIRRRYEIG